jgi:hypothetical protein
MTVNAEARSGAPGDGGGNSNHLYRAAAVHSPVCAGRPGSRNQRRTTTTAAVAISPSEIITQTMFTSDQSS